MATVDWVLLKCDRFEAVFCLSTINITFKKILSPTRFTDCLQSASCRFIKANGREEGGETPTFSGKLLCVSLVRFVKHTYRYFLFLRVCCCQIQQVFRMGL